MLGKILRSMYSFLGRFVMRLLCIAGFLLLSSGQGIMAVEEPTPSYEAPMTLSDYDRQIPFLKEQIAKYDSLATSFDRKASRLQSRDYTQFRRAASFRDECKAIAADLRKHLAKLEQERDLLAKETPTDQTK
jgi:hypothetical protein